MFLRKRLTIWVLFLGDVGTLFLSLLLTLRLRYGQIGPELWHSHLLPFGLLFAVWLLVFYVAGLYDVRRLRGVLDFLGTFLGAITANAFLAVLFFYLIPVFSIAPKTNLALVIVIFGLLDFFWRRIFNHLATKLLPRTRLLLWSDTQAAEEVASFLHKHPHFGYDVERQTPNAEPLPMRLDSWQDMIRKHEVEMVVVPRHFLKERRLARLLLDLLRSGVEVQDIVSFYETVFGRVPLDEIDEEWILEHLARSKRFYVLGKRFMDFAVTLLAQIIFLPIEIPVAVLIKLTSSGGVIYSQKRVGLDGREFTLYKFRTMYSAKSLNPDADSSEPIWSAPKGDGRVTPVGRILRRTHLDELPQFWNVIRGELSFVGPRPERPEFVRILKDQVPHYATRLLVKPGITGWAQIHYGKDQTVEDVKEKIKYDLYYLHQRSFLLDTSIILRTLKAFFVNPK